MKKNICLFILLKTVILVNGLHGQSITDEGNQWNFIIRNVSSPPYWAIEKIMGDTVIDNQQYSKVYFTRANLNGEWLYRGGVRQDSFKRVYVRSSVEEEEHLAFDFNLMEGDTFECSWLGGNNECSLVISAVDSITLLNGEKRKRLHFEIPDDYPNDFFDFYWIEDIGSYDGEIFTHQSPYYGHSDYIYILQCFKQNDTHLIYGRQYYGNNCDITVATETLSGQQVSLRPFPNPFSDVLYFRSDVPYLFTSITIYDNTGQQVKTIPIERLQDGIDLSFLENGLFLLMLEDEKGRQFSKRVIKY